MSELPFTNFKFRDPYLLGFLGVDYCLESNHANAQKNSIQPSEKGGVQTGTDTSCQEGGNTQEGEIVISSVRLNKSSGLKNE